MRALVVGAGPAGLMAAETLTRDGTPVTVFDRMPSAGRKLLLAGRGGLNLTHSEPRERFLARYGETAAPQLLRAVRDFPPERLRAWAAGLGEPTRIGSSGRVFPASWKASPLLRAWLRRLDGLGVRFALRHHWTGWDADGALLFATPDGEVAVPAPAATILALGGGSWPRLGSDGSWTGILTGAGIPVRRLRPANAALAVAWSDAFRTRAAGLPLKRVALTFEGRSWRGEAVVTETGLEGGMVYAAFAPLRDRIERDGEAGFALDLRPDLEASELARRLSRPREKQSAATFLRKAAGLAPVAIGLLREAHGTGLPADPDALARLIKCVTLRATGTGALHRAISSAGGIRFDGLDQGLMCRTRPGLFVAGEMLDWEAPTGGYLLQACFATGARAGEAALAWLGAHRAGERG